MLIKNIKELNDYIKEFSEETKLQASIDGSCFGDLSVDKQKLWGENGQETYLTFTSLYCHKSNKNTTLMEWIKVDENTVYPESDEETQYLIQFNDGFEYDKFSVVYNLKGFEKYTGIKIKYYQKLNGNRF